MTLGGEQQDTAVTAMVKPSTVRSTRRSSGGMTTGGTTASTPLEAMRLSEVDRLRTFLKFCIAVNIMAYGLIPVIDGDPFAEKLFAIGLVFGFVSPVYGLLVIKTPEDQTTGRIMVIAIALIIATFGAVYLWGVFSPGPIYIVIGLYIYGQGASLTNAIIVYAMCAAAMAALGGLTIAGVIDERGLILGGYLPVKEQLVSQGLIQVLFASAFVLARASRKSALEATEQLEGAVRDVAMREALLEEARQDLNRALQVGGPGRYSEQTLGSYKLGVLIGRGGMGEVYEAFHTETDQRAAVKLLHAHTLLNPDMVERFRRETEIAAAFKSENVVRVLEVGATLGELPYFAMERLSGNDLAYHLREKRRLSLKGVVSLLRQLGNGLDEAQEAGVVHRDLKPQNLFLHEEGDRRVWKILDFGVSKLAGGTGTLTKGHVVGTPAYMAPEQAQGAAVDHRADLYALGAIAYRSLTGRPPFSGKDIPAVLFAVTSRMPAKPSSLADLPDDIDRVLAIAIAKKPGDRFQTGPDLADALEAALEGNLSAELRERADALLAGQGWGESAEAPARASG